MMGLLSLIAADPDPAQKKFEFFQPGSTFWMPPQSAAGASATDAIFYFIFYVSLFFFVLVTALMVIFAIRYRRREEGEPPRSNIKHNTAIELTWTIIPLILVLVMFFASFARYMDLSSAPANAIQIHVTGYQWYWLFEYPNGHVDRELHLERDRPFKLILTSNDVTHSMFIPEFREKKDAVPGRYNMMWFTPTRSGEFRAFCAEYCGTKHSDMVARVVVHDPGKWALWLNEAADPFKTRTLAEVGELIYSGKGGCNGCHSIDGSANVGPTFKNIWGKTENFRDGSTLTIDENYLRESIINPNARIVAGYEAVMNSYEGLLSDREITALIEFIKSLSDDYVPPEQLLGDPNDPNAADPNAADPNRTDPNAVDGAQQMTHAGMTQP